MVQTGIEYILKEAPIGYLKSGCSAVKRSFKWASLANLGGTAEDNLSSYAGRKVFYIRFIILTLIYGGNKNE
ncbi:hypothetical protein OXPF_11950 [Oxobacter pfennigii]|uniref:Uncharacterized protein n=1 Tax=Oxobacter pfennigii TaxID=36849 RepID=A0A0P8WC48_9CLOT|nr:hypothetical protein OXPF_11950 [Oxobacter pfennigii]